MIRSRRRRANAPGKRPRGALGAGDFGCEATDFGCEATDFGCEATREERRKRIVASGDERGRPAAACERLVDGENIRFLSGLNTLVADGAEVVVLPAVSGG